jgi:hypothetical protein
MPLNKFIPLSPDPYITSDPEMTLAKFGHLNTIVDYLNGTNALTNIKIAGINNTAGYIDFSANPAGSTTIVGAVRTYQDGVNLSNAMSFIEDGSVGIGTNTPIGILHLKRTAATTRMVMDGDAGQSKIITYRTAGLQRFGLYVNNTAESGSNVGSDFAIRAYNDAGTLLTTPVFIKRSTGNVGINTLTGTAKLQVVGSGSTSATTSLLVQNSAASNLMSVLDNGNVGIGTNAPNASAVLQADSTTKGFLPPRMTTAEKNAIATPAAGLMVYDTTLNKLCVRTATAWETITSI